MIDKSELNTFILFPSLFIEPKNEFEIDIIKNIKAPRMPEFKTSEKGESIFELRNGWT